jgi:hypothetical protein
VAKEPLTITAEVGVSILNLLHEAGLLLPTTLATKGSIIDFTC